VSIVTAENRKALQIMVQILLQKNPGDLQKERNQEVWNESYKKPGQQHGLE